MSKKWLYFSTNLRGNVHDAAKQINWEHPEWDVVAMSMNGQNGVPGSVTAVVYRIECPEQNADLRSKIKELRDTLMHETGSDPVVTDYDRAVYNIVELITGILEST